MGLIGKALGRLAMLGGAALVLYLGFVRAQQGRLLARRTLCHPRCRCRPLRRLLRSRAHRVGEGWSRPVPPLEL